MTATREHLAGLELALELYTQECQPLPFTEVLCDLIDQARSAEPVQGEAVALIVERDIFGTMHIKMPAHDGGEPFDFVQVQYRYPYTDNQSTKRLADQIALLIAGGAATSPAKPDAELVELLQSMPGWIGGDWADKLRAKLSEVNKPRPTQPTN